MTNDVIEVSYTGDLLAHRRCPRAWSYERYAGFNPYEQVQAMEGRLVHHAMEWLTRVYREKHAHAKRDELSAQLEKHFRVLWARGVRTAFASKKETLERVLNHIFPVSGLDAIVKAAVEGAQHTEYELRSVLKLIKANFAGKERLLLTGVLDVVIQQNSPLVYQRRWEWLNRKNLVGRVVKKPSSARPGELEIWDYKGTQADSPFVSDYVRQLLTYAALFRERTGRIPKRCVLFFVNEAKREKKLLAVEVDESLIEDAVAWTLEQVRLLRKTVLTFQAQPASVKGGALDKQNASVGKKIEKELRAQCTACGLRFDCEEYHAVLGRPDHPDILLTNVEKN